MIRRSSCWTALIVIYTVTCAAQSSKIDASTLSGKVLLGYQGWFECPYSGAPEAGWRSWSTGVPAPESLTVDLYPDLSEFTASDLCVLPGFQIGRRPAYVYSASNAVVIERHFRWMEEYGLDGVLVQRFVVNLERLRGGGDVLLRSIISAAARHGRVFAIEYDVTGADPRTFFEQIREDWRYLVDDLKITAQPGYLHEAGKPVLSIWGMGFSGDRNPPRDAETGARIVSWFRSGAPREQRVFYMGGVPSRWRTGVNDSRAGWQGVYSMMDAIQPWTVGRYRDEAGADTWRRDFLEPDLAAAWARKQMYMPVIFPGFSWHNLKRESAMNQIPRQGGRFLWRQAFHARAAGAGLLKIAMFDEVNEGTAVFKAAPTRDSAPSQGEWLTLDADGFHLPSDWYLRLSGAITRIFHGEVPNRAEMPGPRN